MNIKIPFLTLIMFGVLAVPQQASSQMMANSAECIPAKEAIINLRPPFFGTPAVWDAVFGVRNNMIQFSGAVTLENRNLLVVGEALDMAYKPLEHVLVEINSRARAVSEKRYPAKAGERTSGILKTDKGYVVSATIRGGKKESEKWARLAWYDGERNFLRELVLKDGVFDYESMNIAEAANGSGFVAVIKAINRQDESDQHGVLYRLSESGKVLWKRSYRPGITNHIYGVSVTDGNHYIAGGQIRNEDGRMAGWLLKLNDDGTIVWQNTYPRGHLAVFRSGFTKKMLHDSDHYVVVGQVMPYGTDPGAAWVLEVDSLGATVWQRYFRATGFDIDGRGVQAYGDGRISVLANADAKDETAGAPDHIRLLTLSPRGDLAGDEAYLEGHRAEARQLINGWSGERIVTAFIEVESTAGAEDKVELITEALERQEREASMAESSKGYGPPAPTGDQIVTIAQSLPKEIRNEGWVFVATGLDPYTDPCIIPTPDTAP
ncbi:MAG: hypothetical protein ACXW30_03595 [Micavibrio sp.]